LELAGYKEEKLPVTFGLVRAALPMKSPVKTRTIGQRIDRLIKAAKLSENEQQIVEEALLGMNRALLSLVKTTRQK
jgi:hypothetical protein